MLNQHYWNNEVAKEFIYFGVSNVSKSCWYVLCTFTMAFSNFCQSFLYTAVLVVIVRPYAFEIRILKVTVESPNIIEWFTGVQLPKLHCFTTSISPRPFLLRHWNRASLQYTSLWLQEMYTVATIWYVLECDVENCPWKAGDQGTCCGRSDF